MPLEMQVQPATHLGGKGGGVRLCAGSRREETSEGIGLSDETFAVAGETMAIVPAVPLAEGLRDEAKWDPAGANGPAMHPAHVRSDAETAECISSQFDRAPIRPEVLVAVQLQGALRVERDRDFDAELFRLLSLADA